MCDELRSALVELIVSTSGISECMKVVIPYLFERRRMGVRKGLKPSDWCVDSITLRKGKVPVSLEVFKVVARRFQGWKFTHEMDNISGAIMLTSKWGSGGNQKEGEWVTGDVSG